MTYYQSVWMITLGIGTEDVKVLSVDRKNYRLRVLRAQNNTVSLAHTATSVITEDSRKFTYESSPQDDVTFELNKEIILNLRKL